MANQPPDKAARDKNLDALQSAVDGWADKEIKRLDSESKFLRAVVKDRGSKSAGTKNMTQAALKTITEIDNFLQVVKTTA